MVHSDSDLILHNSSVLIDKEPEKAELSISSAFLYLGRIQINRNDCNFPSYMQSTVLNFFMLNKNFVFVTSSTFETSLVPIQFSDVYVIQLLRIALLLVSDTSWSKHPYAFTIYRFVLYTHVWVKPVLLTTLFAYTVLSRNSSVYLMVSSFLTSI